MLALVDFFGFILVEDAEVFESRFLPVVLKELPEDRALPPLGGWGNEAMLTVLLRGSWSAASFDRLLDDADRNVGILGLDDAC